MLNQLSRMKMNAKIEFRPLRADEIECRVGQAFPESCTLLLYKDARVDQRLLDEVVGPYMWQRKHELIDGQLFCTVSIFSEHSREWVGKQDVGTESNTEKEKGRASDAFKRACFNWGIGRELYTAPNIRIKLNDTDKNKDGKLKYNRFSVKEIGYDEHRNINTLVIVDSNGHVRYTMGGKGGEYSEVIATAEKMTSMVGLTEYYNSLDEVVKTKVRDAFNRIATKFQ